MPKRDERFAFVCDEVERKAILSLAAHLKRSQSDAVRLVVREAAEQLAENDSKAAAEGATNEHA